MRTVPQLGWITELLNTGASVYATMQQSKATSEAYAAQSQQAQMQLQAQREAAAAKEAQGKQVMKIILVGGGLLIAGSILYVVIKKST